MSNLQETSNLKEILAKSRATLWKCMNEEIYAEMGINLSKTPPKLEFKLEDNISQRNDSKTSEMLEKAALKSTLSLVKDVALNNEPNVFKAGFFIGLYALDFLSNLTKGSPPSAQELYNQAVHQCHQGNFVDSFTNVNKAMVLMSTTDQRYPEALYLRGCLYMEAREWKRALQDMSNAIRLNPAYSKAYKKRSSILYMTKNYEKALEDEYALISVEGADDTSYFRIGVLYSHLRKYKEALENLQSFLQQNPYHISGHLVRGYVLLAFPQEAPKAVNDFQLAIEHRPDSLVSYWGLAKAYETIENHQESMVVYSQIINKFDFSENPDIERIIYAGLCCNRLLNVLFLAKNGMYSQGLAEIDRCMKDYWRSDLSQYFCREVARNRCAIYLALSKKWKARLTACSHGLTTKEVPGLELRGLERVGMSALVLCFLPISFFGTRQILQTDAISVLTRWYSSQVNLLQKSHTKNPARRPFSSSGTDSGR